VVEIIRFHTDAELPLLADEDPWIFIEEFEEGMFFGSGGAWKPSGEWVGYGSLSEDDVDLDRAVKAACEWARRYNVPTIWIFTSK